MLRRILIIILLMLVEFSTISDCFNDFEQNIELKNLEDNSDSEDLNKEFSFDKLFTENPNFNFNPTQKYNISVFCQETSTIVPSPFKAISSPPPKN